MILEQHYLGCLSQASYLVGEGDSLVVIDPRRDVDLYLERAEALGARVERVLLTHFHADFLAGHLELQKRTGARLHLGAAATAEYEFEPLADGDEVAVGALRLRALATPGHTPESTSYLLLDGERPHAVFTGDTLFIGDVGRPDLMASVGVTKEELARALYRSLRDKLLPLPDDVLVYPGHGAGSACGKNLSSETWSTIGAQRADNYALQFEGEDAFVAAITEGQPPAPAYFPRAAKLNKIERPLLEDVLPKALAPLDFGALVEKGRAGAQVVDTRDREAFTAGHVPGSIWIGLDGQFATWAGAVLDLDAPIVIVADPGREREAAMRLGRIGLDNVVGYFADSSFAAAEGTLGTVRRSEPRSTAAQLESDAPPVVLDVRQPGEFAASRVPGALHVPLGEITARLDEIPADRPVHVHCRTGYRSVVAVSLLQRAGRTNALDVPGGFVAWESAGLPVVQGATCSAG